MLYGFADFSEDFRVALVFPESHIEMNEAAGFLGGGVIGTVVPFLFILTLIVFFHELGHYLVGRWCKVRISTFSIGFGPEIWGFDDKHGTRWRFAAIPLGGYVKFFGDLDAASAPDADAASAMSEDDKKVSFHHQKLWKRAAIVAAGPIASFILGWFIFSGTNYLYGRVILEPRVASVETGSPADKAGFKAGDLIVAVDGRDIEGFFDIQKIVAVSVDVPLLVTVERGGLLVDLTAIPSLTERPSAMGPQKIGYLGLIADRTEKSVKREYDGFLASIYWGGKQVYDVIAMTLTYIERLFAGKASVDQLSGPIGIAKMSGEAAKVSFSAVLALAGLLSVSVGFLNLLPIPMLDGGHLALYAIEAVRGRAPSPRFLDNAFRVGFALVIAFSLWTVFLDVSRYFYR